MTLSKSLLDEVRARAHYACEYCSVTETDSGGLLTADHFQPRSRGARRKRRAPLVCKRRSELCRKVSLLRRRALRCRRLRRDIIVWIAFRLRRLFDTRVQKNHPLSSADFVISRSWPQADATWLNNSEAP